MEVDSHIIRLCHLEFSIIRMHNKEVLTNEMIVLMINKVIQLITSRDHKVKLS